MIIFLLILIVLLLGLIAYGNYVGVIVPQMVSRRKAWAMWQERLKELEKN